MSIYEYDEEKHMRQEREESRKEGKLVGERKKLTELIQKKLAKGNNPEEIADMLETPLEQVKEIFRD